MTALADICAAIDAAPPVEDGFARVVQLGDSAWRAVQTAFAPDPIPERILGLDVCHVNHFDGWDIAEIGEAGVWRTVEVAA